MSQAMAARLRSDQPQRRILCFISDDGAVKRGELPEGEAEVGPATGVQVLDYFSPSRGVTSPMHGRGEGLLGEESSISDMTQDSAPSGQFPRGM